MTDDRIRAGEQREGDSSQANTTGREEERNILYEAAYNLRTRLPTDFPATVITDCLVQAVIFHIPLSCCVRRAKPFDFCKQG